MSSKEIKSKFESCKNSVKKQRGIKNPGGICVNSLSKTFGKRRVVNVLATARRKKNKTRPKKRKR